MASAAHGTVHVANDAWRQTLLADAESLTYQARKSRPSPPKRGGLARDSTMTATSTASRSTIREPVLNRTSDTSVLTRVQPRTRRTEADRERAREELREKYEERQDRIARAMRRKREQQQREEEDKFARMYNELMMEEEEFVTLVKEYCRLNDENVRRKAEALCREWHEKVFDRVNRQVSRQLAKVSSHDIAVRRRKLYEQFLVAANSKEGGLFRDIIIESEYDPLVAREHTIKYHVTTDDDPVKLEVNKFKREQQTLPGEFKESRELGRVTLPPTMWDKLEATPYGRFNKMMAASKKDHGTFKAHVPMDHYAFERVRARARAPACAPARAALTTDGRRARTPARAPRRARTSQTRSSPRGSARSPTGSPGRRCTTWTRATSEAERVGGGRAGRAAPRARGTAHSARGQTGTAGLMMSRIRCWSS